MKRNKGMIILFLTPAVFMFSVIFLYPIIRTVIMSFFKIDGITDPVARWQFTGLANFVKLANTSLFRISMWNLLAVWGHYRYVPGAFVCCYHHQRHPI